MEGYCTNTSFTLPETMANWHINPHYDAMKAESNAWLKSFKPFNERSQLAFEKCDFPRLAALAYPWASQEHLRIGCDLMNVFFVLDEYTDVESAEEVREVVDIAINAMMNPDKPRPEGEVLVGELVRQFWARGIQACTVTARKHFEEAFTDYLNSIVDQAVDRDNDTFRTNIGARPAYIPAIFGIDIPDEAFYHPAVVGLSYLIADILILDNDLASYNKEQATGDDRQNILTVVMHQFGYTLDEALEWVANYHESIEARFLDGLQRLPSFASGYIRAIAIWPRSSDCWNFESGSTLVIED
ncbi:terpenoid synthase [Fomitopsis serialis]|uniref:terpenoid synthase n=1 Tax=Fomitopsis serialis TaxID=139415 RepID=UPI0020087A5A|nr:terpenoid synthase [Neoantrodia serialis]KAH9926487.1 terpenoid synthase [Neoantrodia serialis]